LRITLLRRDLPDFESCQRKAAIDRTRRLRHICRTLKIGFFILSLCVAAAPFALAQKAAPEVSRENKALIQSALADFDSKKYDAALEKLRTLEKALPDDPFVMNLLGAAYTKKKNYPAAQVCFDKALARQPDFFPAKFNVGELLFLQRRYAEALDYFQKMQGRDLRNELLQFKVFLCELQLGNKDAAAKTMKGIKYPGDTPAWYYAKAAWESKNGNKKKALEYLTGAKYIFGAKTALFDETFEDLGINLH
jgi:tetratricopeptide (TPR) repeat protein